MPAPTLKRPLPPAPKMLPASPQVGAASGKKFTSSTPKKTANFRICGYGTGGVGKSSLFARMPGKTKFIDLDGSLPVLADELAGLDLEAIDGIETWQDIRDALHATELWQGVNNVVIDTLSRAEELALKHLLSTRKTEGNQTATSIESYGYGKGYQHLYELFLPLFGDLDQHIREGRNVALICHDCTANFPNPEGEDFIRYEPRLQAPSSGKSSIRAKLKEWCDHLLLIGYDRSVNKDGKAVGGGTRTIYPTEQAWATAKSRTLRDPIPYPDPVNDPEGAGKIWQAMFA